MTMTPRRVGVGHRQSNATPTTNRLWQVFFVVRRGITADVDWCTKLITLQITM
jgi:hypothetical protein